MNTKLLLFCFVALFAITGCESNRVPSVSERIKKAYKAQEVRHDGTLVYTEGGSNNLRSEYSTFRLDLSTEGAVTFRDVTAQSFAGSYTATDNTLTLTGLSPQPTGSNGTLTYSITSISEDGRELTLTSTKANPKTGNTINVYKLIAV